MLYEIKAIIRMNFNITFTHNILPRHNSLIVRSFSSPVVLNSQNPANFNPRISGVIEANSAEEAARIFRRMLVYGWYININGFKINIEPGIEIEDIEITPIDIETPQPLQL